MENRGVLILAAIIAFIIWLLSRKKGGGSALAFPQAEPKVPTDKPLIGGGGSFGGGGASGSWLTETASTLNPSIPKPTPAFASPLQLVDKVAISKPVIEPITPAPSVITPTLLAIKEAFKPQVMPVNPIAMAPAPAPVVPVSPALPKPVAPSVVVPAVPVVSAPVAPAPVPVAPAPVVNPVSPIVNPRSPLLIATPAPSTVNNTIVTGTPKPVPLLL